MPAEIVAKRNSPAVINHCFLRTALIASTVVLSLVACGGGDSGGGSSINSDPSVNEPAENPESPGEESGDPAEPTNPGNPNGPVAQTPAPNYPQQGDPVKGVMSSTAEWPVVPIHVALTPDGRLMSFGRDPDSASEMTYDVWDWRQGFGADSHLTLPNRVGTDLFCSNQLLLSSGEMLITGGDTRIKTDPNSIGGQALLGNSDANVFNSDTNQVTRRGQMNQPRWYASMTALPWGEIYVQGGEVNVNTAEKAKNAEVATEDGSSFRLLTGIDVDDLFPYYPRNFVTRTGHIVGWSHNASFRIDPRGEGSIVRFPNLAGFELNNGSLAVMYRPGKVFLGGGGKPLAIRADINSGEPVYEAVPDMSSPRLWGTATVLVDGKVLIANGGNSDTSIAGATLGDPAYHVDIYDPDTNSYTRGASMKFPRLYHSTAILLPDATVLLAGGGLPGPVTNQNGEVYYPPYLFNDDGSLATRPLIERAPTVLSPLSSFEVQVKAGDQIDQVVLVKTGAVTHSFDMDQRYVPLQFSQSGQTLSASMSEFAADTPPGFYHLFVLNSDGTPSISSILRMNKYTGQLPSLPGE